MRNWQLPAQIGKPQRYEVTIENWLDTGESISSAAWSVPAGVAVSGQAINGNTVGAVLTASAAACPHTITILVVTSGGNQRELQYGLIAH
jgi:hypothetical protein